MNILSDSIINAEKLLVFALRIGCLAKSSLSLIAKNETLHIQMPDTLIRISKTLMRLNVLLFYCFHPQNVFFCSSFLWNILYLNNKNYSWGYELAWNQKGWFCEHGKFIGYILRLVNFNTALEEYKVRYPDGKSDCITKNCFFSVRVIHFLFLNFPGSNCSRFLFFTSFSLAVLIKFVLTKQKLILVKTVFKENFDISVFEGKFN